MLGPGPAMPTRKSSGKSACQLLFPEILSQQRSMTSLQVPTASGPTDSFAGTRQNIMMGCIRQEITSVGRQLEDMVSKISDLAAESRSIPTDIVRFQDRVTGMEHHLMIVENRLDAALNREEEPLYLQNKIADLEHRSRRDNVHFYSFPEWVEGTDAGPSSGLPFPPSPASHSPFPGAAASTQDGYHTQDVLGKADQVIACFL
ncbi:hypothetical protein NDU88_007390 [Pleurodeles waltl]|uniref:Uncharacterized protein n=1 Tax=Pleurodeles waltl TaxID=8319 RepID=A0AAV7NUP6_PLEWA|nr:hypothetical protein NDU88_007390 [Pleurodeles waltl]